MRGEGEEDWAMSAIIYAIISAYGRNLRLAQRSVSGRWTETYVLLTLPLFL